MRPKRFVHHNPRWVTKPLKSMKNRLRKSYKKHGYRDEDKFMLDTFRIERQQSIENAQLSYLTNLGSKINNHITSQKTY